MKHRLINKGDLWTYQEKLPSGDWWTCMCPTTEETARDAMARDIKAEKRMKGFKVIK